MTSSDKDEQGPTSKTQHVFRVLLLGVVKLVVINIYAEKLTVTLTGRVVTQSNWKWKYILKVLRMFTSKMHSSQFCIPWWSNSMEKNPSWEACSCTAESREYNFFNIDTKQTLIFTLHKLHFIKLFNKTALRNILVHETYTNYKS